MDPYQQAIGFIRHKQFEPAVQLLTNLHQKFPENVSVLELLSLGLSGVQAYDKAIRSIEIALALEPKSHRLRTLKGEALLNAGSYEAAMTYFKETIKLYPQSFLTFQRLGVAYMNLEKYEEALQSFDEMLKIHPDYIQGQWQRGQCIAKSGDEAKANEILEKIKSKYEGL